GGYHDAITFNDNAVSQAIALLTDVARGDFGFVPAELRQQADIAARMGRKVIVAAQLRIDGRLTGWGQQSDPFTLEPVSARNYEPAALASGESADILLYLMSLPDPTMQEIAAVHAGAAWLKATAIMDKAWLGSKAASAGRRLVDQPGAGPIWSRYYSKSGKPIFGDRDKSLHDDVNDISLERRNGYAWFGVQPAKALARFAAWSNAHPLGR
ncbi:MAG: pectate lyase, partial [Caulobacter sp.]